MAPSDSYGAPSLSLDAHAIDAFFQEMTETVDFVSAACIFKQGQRALWARDLHQGPEGSSDLIEALNKAPPCATRLSLGSQAVGYYFPLPCANISGLVFAVVIHDSDPPSLSAVGLAIEAMLTCIARQVDVDCGLTTTRLRVSPVRLDRSVTDLLDALASAGNLECVLQDLAAACLQSAMADGVAIAIPDRRIRVIASTQRFSAELANSLLAKLHQPLSEQRKPIAAKVTLSDGENGSIFCAPIMHGRKIVSGMVCVAAATVDASHSRLAREIAGRVSQARPAKPIRSDVVSRFELIADMDRILKSQPTLQHSLIYFDCDKIHTINDAFGYSGGDRALAVVRRILLDSAGAHDVVAHLGGDRFALFLAGASGDTALSKAAQILRFLSEEAIGDVERSIKLSASAGVVDNLAAAKGSEDMLILAEVASRSAQDRGGNQCALFQDIDSSIIQRRSDADRVGFLQMALIENKFVLHAQQIKGVGSDSGRKYELLARLKTEEARDRSPAEFLSAAERYQLMAALDRWVINSALNSIAGAENKLEVSLTTFCINISAQSLQDDSFVELVESRIAEAGVAPDTLCFEITETSLVRCIDKAQRFVHRMQRLGCQVALDDFGTGYSSFAYLKSFPVNYLKIDGAFVRDLLENELSRAIVKSVVAIADVIGAQTVAEHVESEMVEQWLGNAGVNFLQGFSIHKPEPLAGILASMDDLAFSLDPTSTLDLRIEDGDLSSSDSPTAHAS